MPQVQVIKTKTPRERTMAKARGYFVSAFLLLAVVGVGLFFGLEPRINRSDVSLWALLFGALVFNVIWLILYLLVWRKNLARTRHDGWYLLGAGFLVVAATMLLSLVALSFGRS